MAIKTLNDKFMHELGDIYDAEHQFLKGQEEMLKNASSTKLKEMFQTHIEQTREQIVNLEQVYEALGKKPERIMCDGAKGLVSEGQKMIKETQGNPELLDTAIAGSASKVEHYEISAYQGLIMGAEQMGQREIVSLLQQNLEQEQSTAQLIESNLPELLQKAQMGEQPMGDNQFSQATPSY